MAEDNRLLREQNPSGRVPGFLPQHRQSGTLKFEDTLGSDGALHNKIVDVNGNQVDQNNPMPTQLTGSNVIDTKTQAVTIFDAVAITDTIHHNFSLIGQSGLTQEQFREYRNFKITVYNTHGQPLKISLYDGIEAYNPIVQWQIA